MSRIQPTRWVERRVAAAVVAALAACAGNADQPDEPAADAAVQSLTEGPTCTHGLGKTLNEWPSVSDSRTCDGAWQYHASATCANQACGCQVAASCSDWELGPSPTLTSQLFSKPITVPSHKVCSCDGDATVRIIGEDEALPACPGGHPPVCETIFEPEKIQGICNNFQASDAPAKVQARKDAITNDQAADGLVPAGQFLNLVTASAATFTYSGAGASATCKYHVTYPVERFGQSLAVCGCQTFGTCQHEACGALPAVLWSAPDLTKTQLKAAVGVHAVHDATCSTCDDMATPSSRYQCLMAMRQTAPAGAPRSEIDKTKLLVYEFYGDLLDSGSSQAMRNDAKTTYAANPELLTCGTSLPNTCNLDALLGVPTHAFLERCTRLLGSHVPAALAAKELEECMAVLPSVLDAIRNGCPSSLFDDIDGAQEALWAKQLEMPLPTASVITRVGKLADQLRRMELWHLADNRLEASRGHGNPMQGRMETDEERALTRWWTALYAKYGVTAPAMTVLGDPTLTEQQRKDQLTTALDGSRIRGTQAAQDLTTALFTRVTTPAGSVLPLQAYGLFMPLLGDGIGALDRHLDELRRYHDFGCLFATCIEAPSNVARAYRLIARLERGQDLTGALAALPTSLDLKGWKEVFLRIAAERDQTSPLNIAWNDFQPDRDVTQVDKQGRKLVNLVVAAQARDQHYQVTGQLEPLPATLNAGQTQDQVNALVQVVQGRVNDLHQLRLELHNDIVNFTREQIGYNDGNAAHASVEKTKQKLAQQHQDMVDDKAGLEAAARDADMTLATLVDSFRAIEDGLDQNQLLHTEPAVRFQVAGNGAKYTSGGVDPAALSVRNVDVDAGQLLQVAVQGVYKPTCRLRNAKLIGAGGEQAVIELASADAGPEGYGMTWTGSSYKAESVATTLKSYVGGGMKGEVCDGAPGLINAATGLDAKFCLEFHAGLEWSNSDTSADGADTRTSASFAIGLRLSGTPYPDAPVGALLMVVTSRATGLPIEIQIARPGVATVVPRENATVRFIVNDTRCDDADASAKLSVNAVRLTTVGAIAPKVVTAMSEVLGLQRTRLSHYTAQGRVLPGEVAALRSDAYLTLNTKLAPLGLTADTLPVALLGLFNAFLDREVVRIERSVEILDIDRKLTLLNIEQQSIEDALTFGAASTRLREVLLAEILSAIDEAKLRDAATRLIRTTQEFLYPSLKIWYPSELANLAGDALFKQKLAKLSTAATLDPSSSATELVEPIEFVVGRLLDVIEDGTYAPVPNGQSKIVRISFPRPTVLSPDPILGNFASGSRTVDGPRAAAFWNAVLSPDPEVRRRAPVTILPDDIYSTGLSGQGTLPCIETSPVVRRIGFFFGSRDGAAFGDADSLNASGRYLGGATPRLQQFLTQAGILELMLAAGSPFGGFSARVFYGYTMHADQVITAPNNPTRPSGMSPFGTMYLDFKSAQTEWTGGIGTGIPEAEEFVVVLEVDRAQTGGPPPGVSRCQGFVAPAIAPR